MLDQDLPQGVGVFGCGILKRNWCRTTRTDGSRSGDASDLVSFESFLND